MEWIITALIVGIIALVIILFDFEKSLWAAIVRFFGAFKFRLPASKKIPTSTFSFEERQDRLRRLLASDNFKRDVRAIDVLFKQQVLKALMNGEEPPIEYGRPPHTFDSLRREWNDEWQRVADDMGIGGTYGSRAGRIVTIGRDKTQTTIAYTDAPFEHKRNSYI